jgi:hypothetical protein
MAARHPRRTMSRLRPAVTLAILASALSGCLPTATLEHRPEGARICRTVDARGWAGEGDSWTRALGDDRHARFGWVDEGSTRQIPGPLEGVYWVEFSAFAVGTTRESPRPVLVFDPSTAVLEIGGRPVHALPRLWLAERGEINHVPRTELPVPATLNPGTSINDRFFLAFPVPTPRARDTWRIDGGTIAIDGRATALPVAESCFTPSKTWWAPIY